MIERWLEYFAVTVAIEVPIVAMLAGRPQVVYERYAKRAGRSNGEASSQSASEVPTRWPWRWELRWRLHVLAVAFFVNLTTHPFVTVLWLYVLPPGLSRGEELLALYLIEAGVVLAEGLLLWVVLPIGLRRALMISFVANVPSAALSPPIWS